MGICSHRKQAYFALWGKLYESVREHAKNIIDFPKKRRNDTVDKRRIKITSSCKMCYIFGKNFLRKLSKSTNYQKVRDHCHYTCKYRGTAHSYSYWFKLWLSFYYKRISKRFLGPIWMSLGKIQESTKVFPSQ